MRTAQQGIRNPGSPDDVIGYLKSQDIPLESSKEDLIEPYVKDYPVLGDVLTYRSLSKAIGSWLEPFLFMSDWDGALHSRLNPFGTRTFRMSSEDPNAQGVPMEIRGERAFGSMFGIYKETDLDRELWALDLKQAEVRLAACLSGDLDLQDAMSNLGFEVSDLAPSANRAFSLAMSHKPDIVLMDLSIPGVGGLELIRPPARGVHRR